MSFTRIVAFFAFLALAFVSRFVYVIITEDELSKEQTQTGGADDGTVPIFVNDTQEVVVTDDNERSANLRPGINSTFISTTNTTSTNTTSAPSIPATTLQPSTTSPTVPLPKEKIILREVIGQTCNRLFHIGAGFLEAKRTNRILIIPNPWYQIFIDYVDIEYVKKNSGVEFVLQPDDDPTVSNTITGWKGLACCFLQTCEFLQKALRPNEKIRKQAEIWIEDLRKRAKTIVSIHQRREDFRCQGTSRYNPGDNGFWRSWQICRGNVEVPEQLMSRLCTAQLDGYLINEQLKKDFPGNDEKFSRDLGFFVSTGKFLF
jgi:hypothetical protein